MYKAKVIADSISEAGCRLVTIEVTMPRIVLAEYNTHRVFSRNTASSRAIKSERLIKAIEENPFIPEKFPANKAGMQATEWLEGDAHIEAEAQWLYARDNALRTVKKFETLGVHKQIANRLLEPFMWVTNVTSATEWNNFFLQRVDKELALSGSWEHYREVNDRRENPFPAQYEIQKIAYLMVNAFKYSNPKLLKMGEWHLPYVKEEEKELFSQEDLIMLSGGRCGKISFLNHGETNTPETDIGIAKNRMVANKHWSPVEHPATPLETADFCGNFRGWKQQRKFYAGESGELL